MNGYRLLRIQLQESVLRLLLLLDKLASASRRIPGLTECAKRGNSMGAKALAMIGSAAIPTIMDLLHEQNNEIKFAAILARCC